jgi:hypothetical protein
MNGAGTGTGIIQAVLRLILEGAPSSGAYRVLRGGVGAIRLLTSVQPAGTAAPSHTVAAAAVSGLCAMLINK